MVQVPVEVPEPRALLPDGALRGGDFEVLAPIQSTHKKGVS